jgi:hypothetical protein
LQQEYIIHCNITIRSWLHTNCELMSKKIKTWILRQCDSYFGIQHGNFLYHLKTLQNVCQPKLFQAISISGYNCKNYIIQCIGITKNLWNKYSYVAIFHQYNLQSLVFIIIKNLRRSLNLAPLARVQKARQLDCRMNVSHQAYCNYIHSNTTITILDRITNITVIKLQFQY